MALPSGSNLGPYRIIEPVGRGGMASVFKAYEGSLDRYVALKVLPPEFLHDPSFAERFRREAQTIARLEHPQIIPIFAYDIDAETGTPWMAMRLISGGSLSQRIKRSRLAPEECARVLKDVADALDYAHGAGVIHRDVKPQNVLLDDSGRVYLADFGIAKMVESTAQLTQTGMITGTPQYMAPEQALGKPIDKSVDVYALGIVAYELFTGSVPFSADTPVAVLLKQASEPMPLPPVSEVREEVTRAILRATAKDPASRWASAGDFARAISVATTWNGSVNVTSLMEPIVAATLQGAPKAPARAERTVTSPTLKGPAPPRPAPPSPEARPSERRVPGSGIARVPWVVVGLAFLAVVASYVVFRSLRPRPEVVVQAPPKGPVPAATVAPATPEPATPERMASATREVRPELTPQAADGPIENPEPSPAPPDGPFRGPESLTPVERRAILRDPALRERMAALMEARRRSEGNPPDVRGPERPPAGGRNPGTRDPNRPVESERPATSSSESALRTRILLEVEASQPSTGNQVGALFAQVLIDKRPVRNFVIRFTGSSSSARWKRVENIVLEDVPRFAREITLAVGTDPGVKVERFEGSMPLALEGGETSLAAAVRFYSRFDKSVRFR